MNAPKLTAQETWTSISAYLRWRLAQGARTLLLLAVTLLVGFVAGLLFAACAAAGGLDAWLAALFGGR